jgi:hypothetical protein
MQVNDTNGAVLGSLVLFNCCLIQWTSLGKSRVSPIADRECHDNLQTEIWEWDIIQGSTMEIIMTNIVILILKVVSFLKIMLRDGFTCILNQATIQTSVVETITFSLIVRK